MAANSKDLHQIWSRQCRHMQMFSSQPSFLPLIPCGHIFHLRSFGLNKCWISHQLKETFFVSKLFSILALLFLCWILFVEKNKSTRKGLFLGVPSCKKHWAGKYQKEILSHKWVHIKLLFGVFWWYLFTTFSFDCSCTCFTGLPSLTCLIFSSLCLFIDVGHEQTMLKGWGL